MYRGARRIWNPCNRVPMKATWGLQVPWKVDIKELLGTIRIEVSLIAVKGCFISLGNQTVPSWER